MINCAICDDDVRMVQTVKEIMKNALWENECVAQIETYSNAVSFLSDILEYKPLDLVVLDIIMPDYNGMEIAHEIKKRFPDCCIIFLTSHVKYAVEAYELQIFRYTPKSEINTKLPRYLKEALSMLTLQENSAYHITKNEHVERLSYRQILNIRKDGKYSVVCCLDRREIRIRKSLSEVFNELDAQEFIYIDRGLIVNIALIQKVEDHEVVCKNGERLPVSRSKEKETKQRIVRYWGEKI